MKEKLRALGRRWPWLGRALDVQDRVGEVNGGFAASAVTISFFIAIFPLLLVVLAVIGFIAAGDDTLAPRLVEDLGLTGAAAEALTGVLERAANSRRAASVIGLVGLAWAGTAVAVALQQAVRIPWQQRSKGIADRLAGALWLLLAALGFAAAIALGGVLNVLPSWAPAPLVALISVALGYAIEVGLFLWMFWGLGDRRIAWRDLLPGALVAAAGFEVLKLAGTVWVPKLVADSSALYGSLGIVFAVLAWFTLLSKLIVYASALNAVRYEAREGTVTVPLHGPKLAHREAVAATRGGVLLTVDDDAPAVPEPA